jgi:FMN phosphatase YigB (HAD superfamily)
VSAGYRAALFDLFGTLVHFDTTVLPEIEVDGRRLRSTSDGWHDLLADAMPGVSVAEFLRATWQVSVELDEARRATAIEFPSRERFRRALVHVGCDAAAAVELAPLFARGHLERLASVTHFPPAHAEVLERVSGRYAVAVVTNFDDTTTAYEILDRHGILPRLGAVVVSEAVGLRKPHPTLVRLALRALGVAPREAVMIGDHALEDVGAAVAAGVDAVWIDAAGMGVAVGNPAPRYVVESLGELAAILCAD